MCSGSTFSIKHTPHFSCSSTHPCSVYWIHSRVATTFYTYEQTPFPRRVILKFVHVQLYTTHIQQYVDLYTKQVIVWPIQLKRSQSLCLTLCLHSSQPCIFSNDYMYVRMSINYTQQMNIPNWHKINEFGRWTLKEMSPSICPSCLCWALYQRLVNGLLNISG